MRNYLTILLLTFLLGCSPRSSTHPEIELTGFNFAYHIDSPGKVGLVQVFDDGRNTFLQFLPQALLLEKDIVLKARGRKLKATSYGSKYLTVQGIYGAIDVSTAKGQCSITSEENAQKAQPKLNLLFENKEG